MHHTMVQQWRDGGELEQNPFLFARMWKFRSIALRGAWPQADIVA